ncbi:MAG: hypothetical protein HYT79_02860 [Elusimicrobia bacterium]|nr:hypothetical protein [Elusimicrobiota bacterium]
MKANAVLRYGLGTVLLLGGCTGGSHYKAKGDMKKLMTGKRVAILAFDGTTVLTGEGNLASLAARSAAAKGTEGSAVLDQGFIDWSYDLYVNAFKGEGYQVIPTDEVLKSPSYRSASTLALPTTLPARGLRPVNMKKESVTAIAKDLKADYVIRIMNGHHLFNKTGHLPFVGRMLGKNVGQAMIDMSVFDPAGERILWVNAAEISDQGALQVGGVQDPKKAIPMFKDANQKLASKVAAELAKK